MKAIQKGFTLIELMIVVAIIGILAAIAIPAYQDYTIRSQVTEGLSLAASMKTGVSEFFANSGFWPTCTITGCGASSLGLVADPTGKYVSDVAINTAGTLVITYSNAGGYQANAKIDTLTLALQPNLSGLTSTTGNEDVVWVCGLHAAPTNVHQPAAGVAAPVPAGLTTVLPKYLPANCRA
jgi:type IV pilus assembly protein PilA